MESCAALLHAESTPASQELPSRLPWIPRIHICNQLHAPSHPSDSFWGIHIDPATDCSASSLRIPALSGRQSRSCIIEEVLQRRLSCKDNNGKQMKTGIIGLPQVGKTSLFKILTKAKLEDRGYSNPREAHIGVARAPDDRPDKLSALYSPKKTTYATVDYDDVAAMSQEALKETA